MDTHHFKNLKVQYGSMSVLATGYAHYEIEDIGEGHYEFWGEKGKDEYLCAFFTKCVLQDYTLKGKKTRAELGLTFTDKKNIEGIILDTLNEDSELCINLAVEKESEDEESA
jgi:hypothetical protein